MHGYGSTPKTVGSQEKKKKQSIWLGEIDAVIGPLNLWLLPVCLTDRLSDILLIIDSVTALITHTLLLISTTQCLCVSIWASMRMCFFLFCGIHTHTCAHAHTRTHSAYTLRHVHARRHTLRHNGYSCPACVCFLVPHIKPELHPSLFLLDC